MDFIKNNTLAVGAAVGAVALGAFALRGRGKTTAEESPVLALTQGGQAGDKDEISLTDEELADIRYLFEVPPPVCVAL